NQVANGIDAGKIRLHLLIDTYTPAIDIQPLLDQLLQPTGIGTATDSHQDVLTVKALLPLLSCGNDFFLTVLIFNGFDFCPCDDVNAAFAQDAYHQATHLFVNWSKDVGKHFQDGDFGANGAKHTGQLNANDATTHTDQAFRDPGQVPAGIAIDDIVPINTWHR